jgi:hypothetical protein
MLQILATIGLRYETELEQLRYVLAKLRDTRSVVKQLADGLAPW